MIVGLLFTNSGVMCQDMSSLRRKAEDIVKAKYPKWKLITKQERDQQITYFWGPEKAEVTLTIFYCASKDDAAKKMSYWVSHISVGPDVKLDGLGDEAYLWKTHGSNGGVIRFRKDNVYFDVAATSMAVVKDLAKGLAHVIPDK